MFNIMNFFKKKDIKSFKNIKILLINNDKQIENHIRLYLEKEVEKILCAEDGIQGLDMFNKYKPDLVICNTKISGINGVELSKIFKNILKNIYIILLTNSNNPKIPLEAIEAKIDNLILNPTDNLDKILSIIEGVLFQIKNEGLKKSIDCKELFDPLTLIYNKETIVDIISEKINLYKRYETIFSVVLINIEQFKKINNSLGYKTGDKILKDVSKLILSNIRTTDKVGRWDQSKFIAVLSATDFSNALEFLNKIKNKLATTNYQLSNKINIKFSIIQIDKNDDIFTFSKKIDESALSSH